MSFQPGDRFGRYELAELLGKGGMGEVYRAHDTLLHRRVALKVLRASPVGSLDAPNPTDGAARMLREARAAAGIAHPNAIAIYDVGEQDGVPFLAMEFIAGRTLRAFVGDKSITLARRLRWLVDAARGLGAAHQLGLVHRDIKPENIMVGDDGIVKVLDFGIARRSTAKPTPDTPTIGTGPLGTLTADGVVVGTPFYMAPEQMRGEPLDGRADQFAWGVVAYELLTGDLPWEREAGGLQVVAQILSREVDPPRSRNAEMPAGVDAALRTTLHKSATQRFASMEDVADQIEPHAAPPGGMTGRSGRRRSIPVQADIAMAPTQSAAPSGPSSGQSSGASSGASPRNESSTRTQMATQPAPAAVAPSPKGWRTAITAGLAIAIVGAGLARFTLSQRTTKAPPDAAVVVEAESPMSSNAEATAAYRAGMQAFRDASMQTASQEFDRAIQLDPLFAAAHLRRSLLTYEMITASTRQDLQTARNSRASLGEHDRVVLDALEPWTLTPPDLRESQRRLEEAVKKYPGDTDFIFLSGWTLHHTLEDARAVTMFDQVLAKDPTFAMAWCMKGRERVLLDDVPGAVEAYGQCLKVSPGGTSCLEDLSVLQAGEGKCDEVAATSRRLIAVAPDVASSYGALAQALFSLGEPIDAVRAALQQKWDRTPEARREGRRIKDELTLAVLTGHFDAADRLARQVSSSSDTAPDDISHFFASYSRILMDLELGKNADARDLASEYLRRRSAWVTNDFGFEPSIWVYAAQLQLGVLPRSEFDKLRDGWLARERARTDRVGFVGAAYAGGRWSFGHALAAETHDDAVAALAVRPDVHPFIDALTLRPGVDEPVGRTYLLAGRVDEAIPLLTRASRWCAVGTVTEAIFSMWATFELGQALEAHADTTGACAAYERVLTRWGTAGPSSRTAAKARARTEALRCAP